MKTICPRCQALTAYSSKLAGKSVMCSACHQLFEMPSLEANQELMKKERWNPQEVVPKPQPAMTGPDANVPPRYPVLAVIVGIYQFLAAILAVGCVISIIAIATSGLSS